MKQSKFITAPSRITTPLRKKLFHEKGNSFWHVIWTLFRWADVKEQTTKIGDKYPVVDSFAGEVVWTRIFVVVSDEKGVVDYSIQHNETLLSEPISEAFLSFPAGFDRWHFS